MQQADANRDVVVVDEKPDVDYEPEGPDLNDEPATQEEEEQNIHHKQKWSFLTRDYQTMNDAPLLQDQILQVHSAYQPKIMVLLLQDIQLWLVFSPKAA